MTQEYDDFANAAFEAVRTGDKSAIDALRNSSPAARAEIEALLAAKQELQGGGLSRDAAAFGWARMQRDMRRESAAVGKSWLAGKTATRGLAAAAALLLVAQAAVILNLISSAPARYATATVAVDKAAFLVQATFAPTATEADLRALLQAHEAEIVAGPSAAGVYRIAFRSADARDAGLSAFRAAAPIVTTAAVE